MHIYIYEHAVKKGVVYIYIRTYIVCVLHVYYHGTIIQYIYNLYGALF